MLGCQDLAGWGRQGLPHSSGGLTALSLLLLGQLQPGKAQQLSLALVLPVCWAHLAVTSVHLHTGVAALQLLLGLSWILGKDACGFLQ